MKFKTSKSKKSEEKLEEERKTPNSNNVVSSKSTHPKKDDTLQGHENIQPEQTQPIPDHLQHNYKFARICSECYVQNKVSFFGSGFGPWIPERDINLFFRLVLMVFIIDHLLVINVEKQF